MAPKNDPVELPTPPPYSFSRLPLGARLEIFGRHRATVRYVGPVCDRGGTWVGLEWDEAERGKHDGEVDGTRYFQCRCPGARASLVRAEKLAQQASAGVTIGEAVLARYGEGAIGAGEGGDSSRVSPVDSESLAHSSVLLGGRAARERFSRISKLQVVSVREEGCGGAGVAARACDGMPAARTASLGPPALANLIPAVTELDLSGTLVSDWPGLVEELRGLPNLRILDLSRTRGIGEYGTAQLTSADGGLPSLETLTLNDCELTWAEAAAIVQTAPHLRELRLRGNRIDGPPPPASVAVGALQAGAPAASTTPTVAPLPSASFPSTLRLLDLEDNPIMSWDEVQRALVGLPELEQLLLGGTRIARITSALEPGDEPSGLPFRSLEALSLRACPLEGWASVDALGCLPALRRLRISGCPLPDRGRTGGAPEAGDAPPAELASPSTPFDHSSPLPLDDAPGRIRTEAIARLGRLVTLNGSAVGREERRDAELYWWRRWTGQAAGGNESEASRPPQARLRELTAAYERGGSPPTVAAPAPDTALRLSNGFGGGGLTPSSTIELTIEAVRAGSGRDRGGPLDGIPTAGVTKRVPASFTIGRVRAIAARTFKIPREQLRLVLRIEGRDGAGEDLEGVADDVPLRVLGAGARALVEVDAAGDGTARRGVAAVELDSHERMMRRLRREEERVMLGRE